MHQDLGIPVNPLVELLIGIRDFIDSDLMRHNEARFGLARDDEISQVSIVFLYIALAGADGQTL